MQSHARHALWLGLFLVGCAGPAETGPLEPDLQKPQTLVAVRADGEAKLGVTADGGFAPAPARLSLPIEGVTLRLLTGARPSLSELTLPIGDVDISPAVFPPNGIGLHDVTLRLAGPARAEVVHAQAEALELDVRTPLALDWSMALIDGGLHPLGPVVTAPLDLRLKLVRDPSGEVLASVEARCAGTCWSLGGVGQLSDGDLRVDLVLGPLAP
jgi:hypothetical protein